MHSPRYSADIWQCLTLSTSTGIICRPPSFLLVQKVAIVLLTASVQMSGEISKIVSGSYSVTLLVSGLPYSGAQISNDIVAKVHPNEAFRFRLLNMTRR